MELRYDGEADALYVKVTGAPVSRTESLDTGTLVDLDQHGNLVGIEVLRPARRWFETVDESFGNQLDDDDRAMLSQLFAASHMDRPYSFQPPIAV